jgi:AhpD family alkylhydroperoxidase
MRMNYTKHAGQLQKALFEMSQMPKAVEKSILHLVDIRASQINGCTFCLDMHVKEAKIDGERELRLYHVAAWRESNLFTEKEKAALEWTEALTLVSEHKVTEELFKKVSQFWSEAEMANLTYAIGQINLWNRLNIASPQTPGALDAMMGLKKANLE